MKKNVCVYIYIYICITESLCYTTWQKLMQHCKSTINKSIFRFILESSCSKPLRTKVNFHIVMYNWSRIFPKVRLYLKNLKPMTVTLGPRGRHWLLGP